MLLLKFLIVAKIDMSFKVNTCAILSSSSQRVSGSERINKCPRKGDNKEREVEEALRAFTLHEMLAEETGSLL